MHNFSPFSHMSHTNNCQCDHFYNFFFLFRSSSTCTGEQERRRERTIRRKFSTPSSTTKSFPLTLCGLINWAKDAVFPGMSFATSLTSALCAGSFSTKWKSRIPTRRIRRRKQLGGKLIYIIQHFNGVTIGALDEICSNNYQFQFSSRSVIFPDYTKLTPRLTKSLEVPLCFLKMQRLLSNSTNDHDPEIEYSIQLPTAAHGEH